MYYLDIGNTHLKLAEKEAGEWQLRAVARHEDAGKIKEVLGQNPSTGCSVVRKLEEQFPDTRFVTFKDMDPRSLNYETPHTLGMDRVLTCLGAQRISGGAVCVIDAGTACTIDYMDHKNVFQGGVIMPGLGILEHALREFAPGLPETDRTIPVIWPPKSTRQALQWGLPATFLESVKNHINRMEHTFGKFTTWVTGGDALFLMHSGIRAQHFDFLVFEGLETWLLQHNAECDTAPSR